jgi:hypothetical protein
MPLARAICGGWWADRFTLAFPFLRACEGFARAFYDTLFRAAEGAMHQIAGVRLTGLMQGCRMTGIIEAAFPFCGISPSLFGATASISRSRWRTPMADKGNDPVALWQNMIGEMEKGFNAFANQAMASPQFSQVVNQVGGATAGAQKQLSELMEKYLLTMNLPSRSQMIGMAERLQSIEGQLGEIKVMLHQMQGAAASAPGGSPQVPKPPRTKRPPSAEGEQK